MLSLALLHFAPLVDDSFLIDHGLEWVLIVVAPTCARRFLTQLIVDLGEDVQNLYRAAYGIPPVPAPIPDMWLSDEPVPPWIPEPLRLDCYDLPERRVGCPVDRAAVELFKQSQTA